MHHLYAQANELSKTVIEAAIAVHAHYGEGLLESIYVKSLAQELNLRGIKTAEEVPCDLQRFRMQLLSYMKLLDMPLGLVINFGESTLGKRAIRRVILKGADIPDADFDKETES